MSETISNEQKLTALDGYLQFLLKEIPPEPEQEDPLILILVCMQRTLERRIAKTRPTVEWVEIMRWAVIEANKLLDQIYQQDYELVADWNPTTTPGNMVQNLCGWLMVIVHELIGDIAEAEAHLRDELKTAAEAYAQEFISAHESLGAEDGS